MTGWSWASSALAFLSSRPTSGARDLKRHHRIAEREDVVERAPRQRPSTMSARIHQGCRPQCPHPQPDEPCLPPTTRVATPPRTPGLDAPFYATNDRAKVVHVRSLQVFSRRLRGCAGAVSGWRSRSSALNSTMRPNSISSPRQLARVRRPGQSGCHRPARAQQERCGSARRR